MTTPRPIQLDDGPDSISAVAEYLRRRPDFLVNQPELLQEISVPHETGEAVSLVERQVATLRKKNKQLQGKLREWIEVAEHNDQLSLKLHHLTRMLIAARDLDTVFSMLYQSLVTDFRADCVVLWLFVDAPPGQNQRREFLGSQREQQAVLEDVFEKAVPFCGALSDAQRAALFNGATEEVGSAVVLALREADWRGILAIGVRDASRFQAEMGTDFLIRLSEIVSSVICRWVVSSDEQSKAERGA
ncbi:MAG: DUF484 family protein [Gammaproteobacteria bacterium]